MDTFGERLHEAMSWTGTGVIALAKAAKVSRRTILRWERMETPEKVGAMSLLRAAACLHVRIDWLAEGGQVVIEIDENSKSKA